MTQQLDLRGLVNCVVFKQAAKFSTFLNQNPPIIFPQVFPVSNPMVPRKKQSVTVFFKTDYEPRRPQPSISLDCSGKQMVQLPINGIQIDFPYQPYGPQIRYMAKVIDALRSGHNALLESPTGTGKTLCLLCAALAWRSTYVAALQAHAHSATDSYAAALASSAGFRAPTGAAAALTALVQSDAAPQLSAPRIIFASRTHSQLAQAVGELKKTIYSPGIVVLASRDQLCIHDIATNSSGPRLNAMCRRITASSRRGCRYHLPVASNRAHENRCDEIVEKLHNEPPMDIEDLRAFGSRESACPWFLSRAAARAESCDIIFLPYNYLLDRSTRSSLDIDWVNDIVIIDEAHNLEAVCSDAMSFDLTSVTRSSCDEELSHLIEQAARPGGLVIPALEAMAKTEQGLDSVIGSENRDLLEIRLMRSILTSIEEFVAGVTLDKGDENDVAFRVFPGNQLRSLFEKAGGPTADTFELWLEMLDRAMGLQADKSKSGQNGVDAQASSSNSGNNSSLKTLQTAIRVLFESVSRGHEKSFRTVVQQSNSKPAAGRTISYWCFKPDVAMENIKSLNLRSLLLTSGTLSPLDFFATELGIEFPVQLENPHVVKRPQVWAGVITRGPDIGNGVPGGALTSAYGARGDASYATLGRAMIQIACAVPDGVLVFFPSYGALYSCTEAWKRLDRSGQAAKPSIWEDIGHHKHIVLEERESSKFAAAILAHRTNVDACKEARKNGSILLAVCRGKISEGIDFSDEYGRAVVITGLPYPSAKDPKIVLKRQIYDEEAKIALQNRGGRVANSHKVLNGSEWYTIQALRAVNQAVGRAIRHRYDYGAILFCDERFQSRGLQEQLSKWMRPSLFVAHAFNAAENELKDFFVKAVNSEYAKQGERRRLERMNRIKMGIAERKEAKDNTMAVAVAQEAISNLLPPPRPDEQFVQQVLTLTDELNAQKRDRAAAVPAASSRCGRTNLLDFNSESAQGGLHDSGTLRRDGLEPTNTSSEAPKRSALFLATRAKQVERQGTEEGRKGLKRSRTQKGAGLSASTHGASKIPISQLIKELFASKTVIEEFLKMFREMMSVQVKVQEGIGPLQTATQMKENDERAKFLIGKVVQFTREKAAGTVKEEAAEKLLRELRVRVPAVFLEWYDEALK